MPRHPQTSTLAGSVYKSVFARVAERLAAHAGERFPLHIGDTYLDPVDDAAFARATRAETRVALARYSHPHGQAALLRTLRARNSAAGLHDGERELLVTSGATHALFVAATSVLSPGDEVLLLAPYWPLIPGVLRTAGATPVEVPFFDSRARTHGTEARIALLRQALNAACTARTAALYFNCPNNPTGQTLDAAELQALADFAQERRLWILADEVYAGFAFGAQPPLIGSLPGARTRTLSVFSTSKALALAGYRVGWLCGPEDVLDAARKVSTHTVYSVSGIGQVLALEVLGNAALEARARDAYRQGAALVATQLRAQHLASEGGGYVFVDLAAHGEPAALMEALLDRGVALSPGDAFGRSYARWARLCYTAVPPAALERAIAHVNEIVAGRGAP